jgi:hypothetical protein
MINLNEKYTHYKNGKEYIPTEFCKIQDCGYWIDAVIYHSVEEPDKIFCRAEKEFISKFKMDELKQAIDNTRKELKAVLDKMLLKFPINIDFAGKNSPLEILTELDAINKELCRIKDGIG